MRVDRVAQFQIRQCRRPACHFRFPWNSHDPATLSCPRCGSPVDIVLEATHAGESPATTNVLPGDAPRLLALLDNVRSTFNVGSIFRCADGAGISHLYLCGITPTPDHPKVAKTALGAETSVTWSHHCNALDLAEQLQANHQQLWVLEAHPQASPLFSHALPQTDLPIILVVGNEIAGVDPALVAQADGVLTIPMLGAKRSLNVAIAFGIAAYALRFPNRASSRFAPTTPLK
jgi:23S rRNA (guanosine2251-2'-O)-methyltransferase